MGILSFLGFKSKKSEQPNGKSPVKNTHKANAISFEEQIAVFKSLGYEFANGVTKEMILTDGYDESMWEEIKKERLQEIEHQPFSLLYYYFGWRSTELPQYNYSNKCIWFDIEFIDPSDEYIWFMERMGAITNGEISFTDISLSVDSNRIESIHFKVNGIAKSWQLEKEGYIDDSYFQRFSYITKELNTKGNYTYFDDGSTQFVIDYATEAQQIEFIEKTGLKREWLGEGNHFNEHNSNKYLP